MRLCHRCHIAVPRDRDSHLRDLPGTSTAGAGERCENRENEVRAPRRQSSGPRDRLGPGIDIESKPWLRGRRGDPAGQFAGHASIAVRWLTSGSDAHGPNRIQLSGAPRGEPRAARPAASLRALHVSDGQTHPDELTSPQRRQTKIGWGIAPCRKEPTYKASSSSVPDPSSSAKPVSSIMLELKRVRL